MTPPPSLDVRVPLGAMFTLLGGVLLVYGIVTRGDAAIYIPSGALNVNREWGLVMLSTGILLLVIARWRRRTPRSP